MKVIPVSRKLPTYLTWLLETGYERVYVFASDDMWLWSVITETKCEWLSPCLYPWTVQPAILPAFPHHSNKDKKRTDFRYFKTITLAIMYTSLFTGMRNRKLDTGNLIQFDFYESPFPNIDLCTSYMFFCAWRRLPIFASSSEEFITLFAFCKISQTSLWF